MLTVFLDTNIIISGIFFSGLEAEILGLKDVRLVTADICKEETLEVVRRKFHTLSSDSLEIVLQKVEDAFMDLEIVTGYEEMIKEACVKGENDRKVLAAVLFTGPDHFVTGDKDFHNDMVKRKVNVIRSRELLNTL